MAEVGQHANPVMIIKVATFRRRQCKVAGSNRKGAPVTARLGEG